MKRLLLGLLMLTIFVLPYYVEAVNLINGAGGGIEFNVVSVWVPSRLYGQLGVFAIPFNVSDTGILSYSNMYITDEKGQPYYSYLFSGTPPVAVWVDPSISTKTYSIFYGGSNPYSDYIAMPGGSIPLFAGFDDFDYDTGYWIYGGSGSHSIYQSQLYLTNTSAMFNTSYTPGVYALWMIRYGRYGTAVQLYSTIEYKGWVLLRLTDDNFHDWLSIRDGSDIYVVDINGEPLYYSIPYINLTSHEILLFINIELSPGESKTIYINYGGTNPFPQYRVDITHPVKIIDITPPTPTTQTNTYKITNPPTPPQNYITINTTTYIGTGYVIAPHLYNIISKDGKWTYIKFNLGNSYNLITASAAARIRWLEPDKYEKINTHPIYTYGTGTFGIFVGWGYHKFDVRVNNGTTTYSKIIFVSDNLWHNVYTNFTGAGGVIGISVDNTSLIRSIPTDFGYPVASTIFVAGNSLYATNRDYELSYAILWDTVVSYNFDNIITTKPLFFFDPTFYDGVYYINLANESVTAIPFGNIIRIPADEKWLWIIENIVDDNYIHLKFFPVGSVIKFVDPVSNSTVGVVRVIGVGNDAGLVEDFVVELPPGNYTVEAYVPVSEAMTGVGWEPALFSGYGLYLGAPLTGYQQGKVYRSVGGGYFYVEYVDDNRMVGWYIPSLSGASRDYLSTSPASVSMEPFPYMNDYSSTSGLKTIPLTLSFTKTYALNIELQNYYYDIRWTGDGISVEREYYWVTVINISSDVDLTDYQLEITLDSSWDGWDYVSSDGSDIFFLDEDKNPLYYWVEKFDYTNKDAVIWVRVNITSPYTLIYMYYGLDNPYSSYNDPSKVFIFYDGIETWSGWETYGSGEISQSNEYVYMGQYSLKKDSYGDPDGGYKAIGETLDYPFVMEAWIYRSYLSGADSDRIGIIDDNGNGYGIHIDHYADDLKLDIREQYLGSTPKGAETDLTADPVQVWYFARLIWSNGDIKLEVYNNNGELLASLSWTDTTYSSFTRVYVFGGYTYYVDEIRIRKYTDNPPTITIGSSTKEYKTTNNNPVIKILGQYPDNTWIEFINHTSGETLYKTPAFEHTITWLPQGNYTIKTTLTPPNTKTTLTTQAYIDKGYIIAPHTHKWRFDGQDDYIKILNDPVLNPTNEITIETMFYAFPNQSGKVGEFVRKGTNWFLRWGTLTPEDKLRARVETDGLILVFDGNTLLSTETWYYGALTCDGYTAKTYLNGQIESELTGGSPPLLTSTADVYIGTADSESEFFSGYIAFTRIYNRALGDSEISTNYNDHVINASGLVLFLDPTFYDGTHYINLVNESIVGTPYNGVVRVEANEKWLWIVVNGASDDYVHLKYFPIGTIVRFYDSSGNLKYVFVVDGDPNDVGLIEDYIVSVAAGTYTVEVVIPLPGDNVSWDVDLSSVSYTGSRDGYVLEHRISQNMSDYDTIYVLGATTLIPCYGITTTSKSYPPISVWGDLPVLGNEYNVSSNTSVVFDARFYIDGSPWVLALINATLHSDVEPVVAVYGNDTHVYLYYRPDKAFIDTGLTYSSGWIYVFIEFKPPNTIIVGIGDGDYSTIYSSYSTYTYTATNYSEMELVPSIGSASNITSLSSTIYVDWLRVRTKYSTISIIQESSLQPYAVQEVIDTYNNTNWTIMIRLDSVTAFRAELMGVNKSLILEYNNIYEYSAYDGAVVSINNVIQLLDENYNVLNQATASLSINDYLVITYSNYTIYIGELDDSTGKYSVLLSHDIGTVIIPEIHITYASTATPSIHIPLYTYDIDNPKTFNITPTSITQTIAPSGSISGYTFVGYMYDTVINNNTYIVKYGVLINTSGVYLYINDNGTEKTLNIGMPSTPMVIGVGFDYDNNTNTLSIYSMITWLSEENNKLVTHYITGFLDITPKEPIEWGYPLIESINSTIMVDRFGLTIGWLMNQIIHSKITFSVGGYYPVGGLVKYVTITSPIKIKLGKGEIETLPNPSGSASITLEGFRGWTLSLSLYGTSISEITITSDEYPVEFPTGFTAVIIADISARKLSIVSAEAPGLVHSGALPESKNISVANVYQPKYTSPTTASNTVINMIILASTLFAAAIASSRLTGSIGDGVIVAGFVSFLILLAFGDYVNASVAMVALLVGIGIKKGIG